jgi:hypothetical protein
MAVFRFDDDRVGEAVFETITSPCEVCPVYHQCKYSTDQGGDRCVEKVTEYYEREFNR